MKVDVELTVSLDDMQFGALLGELHGIQAELFGIRSALRSIEEGQRIPTRLVGRVGTPREE